ncbi:MurR/RpiR family transcriptional regulator [Vagococcus sp. PNs007]|uniref:MurR/RpiR family transcriptional regulator n=1 Tax=Vagococcus proximus TaxID=2991417 RepID=A0ABT5X351_9ENTE|nr:MurR/RpiR family transcriptional regulator [Vagococcus proximus]MDF0480434.1 MurR/RpiR family transcriptional regulator [Vagococcus proximus]
MTIFELMQAKFPEFSDKEKQIATYILGNRESIKNINISKLAEVTHSSPATITRFSKKLMCNNFVDLKIKVNSSMSRDMKVTQSNDKVDDVYNFYTKVIENTKQTAKVEEIHEVVEAIKKAGRILVFGVGSSGFTAQELTQRLVRMGLNASAITDPHFMIISSSIVTEDDLVIGISTSGETTEVVNAISLAKNSGAKVISFTSFSSSSIAKLSDRSLVSFSSKFVGNQRFVNSQFATMYLIDVISTELLENDSLSKKMNRTIKVITNPNDLSI